MAFPTTVNDQVTDSVTQTNVKNLGDIPSVAMATLTQMTAAAVANAAHNNTTAQQNTGVLAQAASTLGVTMLQAVGAKIVGEAGASGGGQGGSGA